MILGPTFSSASLLNGSTYHSCLGLGFGNNKKMKMSIFTAGTRLFTAMENGWEIYYLLIKFPNHFQ